MTLHDVLAGANIVALLSVSVFIVTYARVTWWRSTLGRTLMAGAFAVGFIAVIGVFRRLDNRFHGGDHGDILSFASAIAYLVIAATWAYKTYVIVQENRRIQRASRTDSTEENT